jgi:hypothetical protein
MDLHKLKNGARALLAILSAVFLLSGCETTGDSGRQAHAAMVEEIKTEPQGNFFIGRRFYKEDYKFWGYIRKPGEQWGSSKLVMLNEQQKLAPDREANKLGSDHGYEYKLYGRFSGDTVYEPASNGFYPEFVLTGYELRSSTPPPIFRNSAANNPAKRIIEQPY